MIFTFAPRTPMLAAMITVGRLFPRGDRAPWIEPVAHTALTKALRETPSLAAWNETRHQRVASGFYKSHALELLRS
jgi:magnesium-protoporphyrin O-methyltransferase